VPNSISPEAEDTSLTPSVVIDALEQAGWNFSSILSTTPVCEGDVKLITEGEHLPSIRRDGKRGPFRSWELNYPALSFLLNGQYYSEYQATLSLMGLPVMSDTAWQNLVALLGKQVEAIALASCEQVREKVAQRGDKLNWTASFDGFYLTRGHHSNNSSATLHDYFTNKIAWFAHRTKKGPGANWDGTSNGAEGDMLRTILEDVKDKHFNVSKIIMDHDTSGGNIANAVFPEVRIQYCGNHSAKTFHRDLVRIKSVPCKVSISVCYSMSLIYTYSVRLVAEQE